MMTRLGRSGRFSHWACAILCTIPWAGRAVGDVLEVEETPDRIIVRSDRPPTWAMEIDRAAGRVKGLVIPARDGFEVVRGHPWANVFGVWMGYHNFAETGSWQASNRSIFDRIDRCEVVARSPGRVVVAVAGEGFTKAGERRYAFRQHILFEPAGVRTDLEIVNASDDPWRCVQIFSPCWFRGGAVPDVDDPRIRIWDVDTPPFHPDMKRTRTQDDFVPLPEGITHPFSVRVPLLIPPTHPYALQVPRPAPEGVSLVIREVSVPDSVRERNEWSMPLGFAQRPGADGWAWWLTGGASPGAIKGQYSETYRIAPAGMPQVLAWSVFPTLGDAEPGAEIAPHSPALPE